MQCGKKGGGTTGARDAPQNEIFCYYISHYADLCQIRGSDWIKLGPKPRNLRKVVCGASSFLFLITHGKKREPSFMIWLQGWVQFRLLNSPQGASELKH